VPQIEVTFDIDANGILNVSAKDKATSKEQKITITHSSGLKKDEVQKMVDEAKANEADDKKRREVIEEKNRAEQMSYAAEKLLKESGDKLPADAKQAVEDARKELDEARAGEDVEKLRAAIGKLEQATHKVAEELYKSAAPSASGPSTESPPAEPKAAAGEGKAKDDVVDAEFRPKS